MQSKLKWKEIEDIEKLSLENLELLSGLKGANNE